MNRHVNRLLKKKIAFVGSADQGKPSVKAMLVSRREGSTFYFDSNNSSQSAARWKENPSACVYFYSGFLYRGVLLSGAMEIINDMEVKKRHWKRSMKAVYKGGVTDPDYCILKFTATAGRHYFMYRSEDFAM